jgi:hypothetical protein
MITAALTWPQASVYIAVIAAGGLVLSVLVWSIFSTGQTAIRSENGRRETVDNLRHREAT